MSTRVITFVSILFCGLIQLSAQTITGNLANHQNQKVYLYGYNNFDAYAIDSTITNAKGDFKLNFAAKDYGMGYIAPQNQKPLIVVLANETVHLTGDATSLAQTVNLTSGAENSAFLTYATQHPKRENALSAWRYLDKLYKEDPTFSNNTKQSNSITNEIERLKNESKDFIENLPQESYVKWFLPIRQLVSSVATVAQYYPEEIPATRKALRAMNLADDRFYKSGLLNEAIENHIWFIENSSGGLEQVFEDLNQSIDIIINQLKDDNEKFNLVTQRMFDILEKRSLFASSEYLAKRLLEGDDCGCLNPDFEKHLHKYGKMAQGEIAPDITFTPYTYYPDGINAKKMSEVKAEYYLVIFAAQWCPHCREVMPEIAAFYPEMKAKNIETLLVSLDENVEDFARLAGPLPFISTTELKKWESQAAIDYQVYGTPSYFMLDKDRKIVMKFMSVEHIKSWVNMFVKK
jgi:thiol-disulfide isomerase/thioredoxin